MPRMSLPKMATGRLLLVAVSPASAAAAASGNSADLARVLDAVVPEDWPPRIDDDGQMAREGFAFVRNLLAKDPSLVGWWGWFVLVRENQPRVIGAVGTKGPPASDGIVEVSYGIVRSEQQKGYATEATLALIERVCSDSRTRRIVAETFPHLVASIAVMKKCGLTLCGEGSEPGTIRYGANKEDLRQIKVLRGLDPNPS
jgi:ribosomal-protein-alanine N-acetyltransferase